MVATRACPTTMVLKKQILKHKIQIGLLRGIQGYRQSNGEYLDFLLSVLMMASGNTQEI